MKRIVLTALVAAALAPLARAEDKPNKEYKGKPAARLVHYSGNVQGVGFRDTAVKIAQDYPVTGWVKNLSDGRVELLAEGPADALDDFLKAIRVKWKDNIKDAKVEEQKVSGKYRKFTVER
jgi:acylphosphatase